MNILHQITAIMVKLLQNSIESFLSYIENFSDSCDIICLNSNIMNRLSVLSPENENISLWYSYEKFISNTSLGTKKDIELFGHITNHIESSEGKNFHYLAQKRMEDYKISFVNIGEPFDNIIEQYRQYLEAQLLNLTRQSYILFPEKFENFFMSFIEYHNLLHCTIVKFTPKEILNHDLVKNIISERIENSNMDKDLQLPTIIYDNAQTGSYGVKKALKILVDSHPNQTIGIYSKDLCDLHNFHFTNREFLQIHSFLKIFEYIIDNIPINSLDEYVPYLNIVRDKMDIDYLQKIQAKISNIDFSQPVPFIEIYNLHCKIFHCLEIPLPNFIQEISNLNIDVISLNSYIHIWNYILTYHCHNKKYEENFYLYKNAKIISENLFEYYDILILCDVDEDIMQFGREKLYIFDDNLWYKRMTLLSHLLNLSNHLISLRNFIAPYMNFTKKNFTVEEVNFEVENIQNTISKLSVTSCEKIFNQPYHFYAQKILNLRNSSSQAGRYGSAIHKMIELQHKKYDMDLDDILNFAMRYIGDIPSIKKFFYRTHAQNISSKLPSLYYSFDKNQTCQHLFELAIEYNLNNKIEIIGRIDHVIYDKNEHSATIIDYKTSTIPTKKSILASHHIQVSLLSFIMSSIIPKELDNNSNENIKIINMSYIKASSTKHDIINIHDAKDIENLLQDSIPKKLEELTNIYDDDKLRIYADKLGSKTNYYDEYLHLARLLS